MFRSILVTLDDPSQAAETLAVARTVASATGGSLTLLHVERRFSMVLASEAESDLKATAAELGDDGLQVNVVARHGEPATETPERLWREESN
jgi:nucleotide-binding universal stress UspA family protein